tara:strand:+ start:416 stop:601 length:186 start_codon:yes stop_codon:yes gene_type:complete
MSKLPNPRDLVLNVEDRDKYVQKAKNVEKRINKYSREAERLVNRLSDKTIEFIDELSSTKK